MTLPRRRPACLSAHLSAHLPARLSARLPAALLARASSRLSRRTPPRLPPPRSPPATALPRAAALVSTALLAMTLLATALLTGCASAPPARLLHLRAAPPVAAPAALAVPVAVADTWLLQTPVRLPDYLDRDALLLREGQAGLQRLPGFRWAEPLRDSVPRLLRADLATLLGEGRVWTLPLPAGVQPTRQLRLEILGFEADAAQQQVLLQARWSLAWADGRAAPLAQAVTLQVPVEGSGADALAAAHRLAVWRLAQRVLQGS